MKANSTETLSPRFGKVFLLSLWSTVLRFFCQFGIGKISALYLGPSGMFLFGQIQNILAIGGSLSGGSIQTGITRYSATSTTPKSISKALILGTAILTITGAIIWGIFSYLYDLNSSTHLEVTGIPKVLLFIVIIPLSLIISVISQTITSLLQGKQLFSLWNNSLTAYSLINLTVLGSAIFLYGEKGILPAMLLVPVARLIISMYLWKKSHLTINSHSNENPMTYLNPLSKYLLTGLSATALTPFILILIRTAITTHTSENEAGLWQGMWRISELGTSVLVALFGSWFVPKIASASSNIEIHRLARVMTLRVIILVFPTLFFVWLFRNQCISLILSESFLPLASSIHWQLSGDGFRSIAWIFGTILIVRGHFRQFLIVEIGGQLLFLALSLIFVSHSGYTGVMQAYSIESYLDMLLCIYLTLRVLR